jgi:hypothetical protein
MGVQVCVFCVEGVCVLCVVRWVLRPVSCALLSEP